jgi:hypothetical protein
MSINALLRQKVASVKVTVNAVSANNSHIESDGKGRKVASKRKAEPEATGGLSNVQKKALALLSGNGVNIDVLIIDDYNSSPYSASSAFSSTSLSISSSASSSIQINASETNSKSQRKNPGHKSMCLIDSAANRHAGPFSDLMFNHQSISGKQATAADGNSFALDGIAETAHPGVETILISSAMPNTCISVGQLSDSSMSTVFSQQYAFVLKPGCTATIDPNEIAYIIPRQPNGMYAAPWGRFFTPANQIADELSAMDASDSDDTDDDTAVLSIDD